NRCYVRFLRRDTGHRGGDLHRAARFQDESIDVGRVRRLRLRVLHLEALEMVRLSVRDGYGQEEGKDDGGALHIPPLLVQPCQILGLRVEANSKYAGLASGIGLRPAKRLGWDSAGQQM